MDAALRHALGMIETGDEGDLVEAIDYFGELLEDGGPLADIRFDRERFTTAVAGLLAAGSHRDPFALAKKIFPATIGEIVTSDWLESFSAMLPERARAAGLRGRALEGTALAYVMVAVARGDVLMAPDLPPLEALFHVQLAETVAEWSGFESEIDRVAADVREGRLDPRAIEREAERIAARSPQWVAASSAREAPSRRRIVDRCCARLRSDDPPALLTLDEWLWVTVSLRDAVQNADPATRARDRAQTRAIVIADALHQIVGSDLVDAIVSRLVAASLGRRAGSGKRRRLWGDFAIALIEAPERLVLEALRGAGSLWWRWPQEKVYAQSLRRDNLEEYARRLDELHEHAAAARVRDVVERLGDLSLPPGLDAHRARTTDDRVVTSAPAGARGREATRREDPSARS